MDLNMVRAGVVEHPSEWQFSGYNEILHPRERYQLIDYDGLMRFLNFDKMADLAEVYRGWIEESMGRAARYRDEKWTKSVAVGSKAYVNAIKEELGYKAKGREVYGSDGSYQLKESPAPYNAISQDKIGALRFNNAYFSKDSQ
jgi:putative transposase